MSRLREFVTKLYSFIKDKLSTPREDEYIALCGRKMAFPSFPSCIGCPTAEGFMRCFKRLCAPDL